MRRRLPRARLFALAGVLLAGPARAGPAPPAPVEARFVADPADPSPFPADWLTVPDRAQRTGRRVALPLPRCAIERSACDDVRLLDELDGFDLDPRLAVRFTGPIDPASVSARSMFLLRLVAGPAELTAVDRVVWDPDSRTLFARPETLLEPETRYGLVVTRELRDAGGRPIAPAGELTAFRRRRGGPPHVRAYRQSLADLDRALERRGLRPDAVAAAAVFTTGSISAFLEQAREALDRRPPPPAAMAAPDGGGRAWFPRRALSGLVLRRQVTGGEAGGEVEDEPLPLAALAPAEIAGLGIGWYWSPWYLGRDRRIAEGPSLAPLPGPPQDRPVPFVVILPAGRPPPDGWPVAIFGHGYGGEMLSSALLVAGGLARQGIATVAISVVGHGGGPESRLVARLTDGRTVTTRVPGRGSDVDGDGRIGRAEGLAAPPGPLASLGLRDGLRQQVVDLMALVRALRGGLDADGDGRVDTSGELAGYAGQSLGGIYGTIFLAVEPRVRVGVLNVPGGPVTEVARLSPVFRPEVRQLLARREPPLLNLPGDFREDLPGHGESPVRAPAAGALPIQAFLARASWLARRGDPVAFAPHLWRAPLPGIEPARVLVQFALDDRVVPNATTRTLLRAGALDAQAVLLRTDRVARLAGVDWPDPHGFLLHVGVPGVVGQVARAAQAQMARFLRDGGDGIVPAAMLPLPAAPEPLLEVPGAEPDSGRP